MNRPRVPLLALVLILTTGCGSTVPPQPSPKGRGPAPTSSGSAESSTAPTASASLPPRESNVPADIAADVDALLATTTYEAAVAATRTILEKSGMVITDDPTTVTPTAAGIYLSALELDVMAEEARGAATVSRVSLADFAIAFGGVAGLPPNESVVDHYEELDFGVPDEPPAPEASPSPGTNQFLDVNLNAYPAKMSAVMTTWVNDAAEWHTAAEPELAQLSNAPLYLRAFAERQLNPVDIGQPFSAHQLELGTLQLTVLMAGIRANLAHALAEPVGYGRPRAPTGRLASVVRQPPAVASAPAAFSDCDQLKHLIDSHVPFSTPIGMAGKEFIKSRIKGFVDGLFGSESQLSKYVGPAFTALGLLFRIAALVMLYEHANVKLKLDPAFVHKPVDIPRQAAASVKAGIPDEEWERAKQQREEDSWSTALRMCARFLGVPVTKDLIDLGEGIKNWKVQWEITRGLQRHVLIPGSELTGPGVVTMRLERPLGRIDDHSGGDILAINVLPEKQSDHPGTERSDAVTVCARVVPREPLGGFKTFLSAGFAGKSLAASGNLLVSLAGLFGEILAGWYRELATIDACENMNVSYHVPEPMPWRGKVRVNWESHQSSAYSERTGDAYSMTSSSTHVDVTEDLFVGGLDRPDFAGVSLNGNSFVHGAMSGHRAGFSHGFSSFCTLDKTTTEEGGGGWSFDGSALGGMSLYRDGRYTIQLNGAEAQDDLIVPSTQTYNTVVVDGICDPTSSTDDIPLFPPNDGLPRHDTIEGQIDPANPGNRLAGSQTTIWDDGSVTTIEWDLTHEGGPIRLPQY